MENELNKLHTFVKRLKRIGIDLQLIGNTPWIYIDKINGKKVTEKFEGNHGFTVAFQPVRVGKEMSFTDLTTIFNLIRKYK